MNMSLDDVIAQGKKSSGATRPRASKGKGRGKSNDKPIAGGKAGAERMLSQSLDDIISSNSKKASRVQKTIKKDTPSRGGKSKGKGRRAQFDEDWEDEWEKPRSKGKGKGKGGKSKGKGKGGYRNYGEDDQWESSSFSKGGSKGSKGKGKGKGRGKGGNGCSVAIKNLDFSIMADDLVELFSRIGGCDKVWVDYDHTDRSLCTGGALFESPDDAWRALKFDGQPIEGKAISIKIENVWPENQTSHVVNC